MAVQTTYNLQGANNALGFEAQGIAFCHKFEIDTAAVNVGAADVLKLMEVPAETVIEEILIHLKTAEGGTLTVDIGDYVISSDAAVDADGFIDGANLNAAAGTTYSSKASTPLVEAAPNTIRAYTLTGKLYKDALNYIGVLVNNAADAAIFDVYIVGKNLANG